MQKNAIKSLLEFWDSQRAEVKLDTKRIATSRLSGNLFCALAMVFFAAGFPAAEFLLENSGVIALISLRNAVGFAMLLVFLRLLQRETEIFSLPWRAGFQYGFVGFGFGSVMLLVAQSMSDATTAALAVAVMPITAIALEVVLDERPLTLRFLFSVLLVLIGGVLASGVMMETLSVGVGFTVGLIGSGFYAWGSRQTVKKLPNLTPLSRTTVTTGGMVAFCLIFWIAVQIFWQSSATLSITTSQDILLLLIYSVLGLSISQVLWIKSVGDIGVGIASFHLNATPFYVMVIIFLFGGGWNWMQTVGVLIVLSGAILAQLPDRTSKNSPNPV